MVNAQEDKITFLGPKDRIQVGATHYKAKPNYRDQQFLKFPLKCSFILKQFVEASAW